MKFDIFKPVNMNDRWEAVPKSVKELCPEPSFANPLHKTKEELDALPISVDADMKSEDATIVISAALIPYKSTYKEECMIVNRNRLLDILNAIPAAYIRLTVLVDPRSNVGGQVLAIGANDNFDEKVLDDYTVFISGMEYNWDQEAQE
jgi:hypothetical protein